MRKQTDESNIGSLKYKDTSYELFYPDSNSGARAEPLTPPQSLNTSESKNHEKPNVLPYLSLLPHPKDHVELKKNVTEKKVKHLMEPFLAMIPNKNKGLITNEVIPPFLAKYIVGSPPVKGDREAEIDPEMMEWMHTKGLVFGGKSN